MTLSDLISVARGEKPADLVLANAQVVNVFTAEVEAANVAVVGDTIAGVGDYLQGKTVLDLGGRILAPGLIDGHTHPESSLLHIGQYASAVVPRGTTSVVTDFHEIANVCGLEGLLYVRAAARRLPLDMHFLMPSCVPATHLETSGATLGPAAVRRALKWRGMIGLGEVMSFQGVLNRDAEVLQKLEETRGRVMDGHSPGLSGRDLNAYLAAGPGSCHETTTFEEGREKLRRGMFLFIREGSSEKNLEALLPLVTDKTYSRCAFVVDDRSARDVLRDGDMDAVVRKAIGLGLDPVRAIQLATINPARHFNLGRVGAVGPGYRANLVVLDDLARFHVQKVFHRGRPVAEDGKPLFHAPAIHRSGVTQTVKVKSFAIADLALPARGAAFPAIQVVPGQILTRRQDVEVTAVDGLIRPDVRRDILKAVVVERHRASGNIGLGLAVGFGLKRGALASSVAHDSHNIVAVGALDEDIYVAVQEVIRLQGGLVVAAGGKVWGSLALPVAGLLSPEPLAYVVSKLEGLELLAHELGCMLPSPFSTLSFLALPVIPELRLTDKGLVDVASSRLI